MKTIEVQDPPLLSIPVVLFLHKQHRNLVDRIDEVMQEWTTSGKMEIEVNKHMEIMWLSE